MFTFTWLGIQYTWSQAQLDTFWARYAPMKGQQVCDVCNQEPEFKALYIYCMQNRLYGFADYNRAVAGSNLLFAGNATVVSGPTLS
jgi:hypothetical protein